MGVILIATRIPPKAKKGEDANDEAKSKPKEHRLRLFLCDHASVGRADDNDLILGGDKTSVHHARFHWRDNELVVVDLQSKSGTFLNGKRIGGEAYAVGKSNVTEKDVVRIGDWNLRFVPDDLVIESEEERQLFDAIARDPASDDVRQVYGDWLEERGRTVEAELIAIERLSASLPPNDKKQRALNTKRRELARTPSLRASWRCVVTRPAIEGCLKKMAKKCPGSWDRLTPTPELRLRKCAACNKHVYFMTDVAEGERRMNRRHCFVIDPGIET